MTFFNSFTILQQQWFWIAFEKGINASFLLLLKFSSSNSSKLHLKRDQWLFFASFEMLHAAMVLNWAGLSGGERGEVGPAVLELQNHLPQLRHQPQISQTQIGNWTFSFHTSKIKYFGVCEQVLTLDRYLRHKSVNWLLVCFHTSKIKYFGFYKQEFKECQAI